jgi:hypothetical protein
MFHNAPQFVDSEFPEAVIVSVLRRRIMEEKSSMKASADEPEEISEFRMSPKSRRGQQMNRQKGLC